MTIRKFNGSGGTESLDKTRVEFGRPGSQIEVPQLLTTPEQRYEGTWEPGINHPTLPPLEDGPHAGIERFLPIPESQIER